MRSIIFTALCCLPLCLLAQPSQFTPRGVGGGGALFSPSINPANTNEFYVGCDMSEVFQTTNFGTTFSLLPFQSIQGGHNSKMQFTSRPSLRYCISYAHDQALPVKSVDGGATWTVLPGTPDQSEETYTIDVDFDHPNRVLISYYNSLHFSSDSGATFAAAYAGANSGYGVAVGGVFFAGDTILVGTRDGMLVSTNGGRTFAKSAVAGIPSTEGIYSFAGARQGGTIRLFCLTGSVDGIYTGMPASDYWGFMKNVYSLDFGAGSWISRLSGITIGTDFPMLVAMAHNDISTAYLGGSSSAGEPNVLKTTNGGSSWTRVFRSAGNLNIATGWCGAGGDRSWGYAECLFGLAVGPLDPTKLVFTDFGFVHTSADGGATWRQSSVIASDLNPPGANTPQKKAYHTSGLENTSCWQIIWTDAKNMFACFSDIRGLRSTDGGASWSFNYTGHVANTMYRIAQPSGSGAIYGAASNVHDLYQSTRLADATLDAADAQGAVLVSTNGGAAWSTIHTFGHPVFWIAADPTNANRLYASVVHSTQGGVYVSNDIQNGASSVWTRLSAPPRTQGHPACIVVLNDGTLVCTYSGRRDASGAFTASSGLFVSTDRGTTWTDRSDNGMKYWTKDVVIDPNDAAQNTWYVCVFSGWGGPPNNLGGLYRTTNRGATWNRVNALDRVTSIAFNPANSAEAYLTTETSGLWHSVNMTTAMPTFTSVPSYQFRQPERVFFNPYVPGEVWVSSFGAGMKMGTVATTEVLRATEAPVSFTVVNNFPNPFNPSTTISYRLPKATYVRLSVFDLLGHEMAVIKEGPEQAGEHTAVFDGSTLPSGLYLCRLIAGGEIRTLKMILAR